MKTKITKTLSLKVEAELCGVTSAVEVNKIPQGWTVQGAEHTWEKGSHALAVARGKAVKDCKEKVVKSLVAKLNNA